MSKRWQAASTNEFLWRELCAHATRVHDDPDSFHRLRQRAKKAKSWRAVFPDVAQVRWTGLYYHRQSYVRKGYRDKWHDPPPVIMCIYHRILAFRPDGTVFYASVAGELHDAIRVILRALPILHAVPLIKALSNVAQVPASRLQGGLLAGWGARPTGSLPAPIEFPLLHPATTGASLIHILAADSASGSLLCPAHVPDQASFLVKSPTPSPYLAGPTTPAEPTPLASPWASVPMVGFAGGLHAGDSTSGAAAAADQISVGRYRVRDDLVAIEIPHRDGSVHRCFFRLLGSRQPKHSHASLLRTLLTDPEPLPWLQASSWADFEASVHRGAAPEARVEAKAEAKAATKETRRVGPGSASSASSAAAASTAAATVSAAGGGGRGTAGREVASGAAAGAVGGASGGVGMVSFGDGSGSLNALMDPNNFFYGTLMQVERFVILDRDDVRAERKRLAAILREQAAAEAAEAATAGGAGGSGAVSGSGTVSGATEGAASATAPPSSTSGAPKSSPPSSTASAVAPTRIAAAARASAPPRPPPKRPTVWESMTDPHGVTMHDLTGERWFFVPVPSL